MEINGDIEFQRRVWFVQRVGWFAIVILTIAAILGFFGNGWLSRASAQGGGLRIEYERFARYQTPTKLRLLLSDAGETTQVEFSRRYLDSVQVEQITPEPNAVESIGEWLIYRFSGPRTDAVTFHLTPDEFGNLSGSVKISGGNPVVFNQFVYP